MSSLAALLLLLLLLSWSVCGSGAHRPVVIVHGLFDGPRDFRKLTRFIQEVHPGTEVTALDMFNGVKSLWPLWTQVKSFRSELEARLNQSKDGAHLICFSQGGVICRALLSVIPNHNVHSFISLSAPLAGQYGDTDYLKKVFPKFLKKNVYKMCYNKVGQDVSICQYWNDPHQRNKYLKYCNFLPRIDGETPHKDTNVWRQNFLRIKKLVLIGGPDDGVITPWQSSHFGFYDFNETVVEMKNQEFYRSDVFGLKTLDARGDVVVCEQSGVAHVQWHSNFTVFANCIQKWLT
ncbi:lysosomal thioesterase PPT2-A-like [Eucyclogobius newberryi]|uniref:lysosomal thioesterase PPT2-A-like n=1 Tax=Eucyclogobius newberryi TaxID=166745 RepID=UPI003B596CCB